MNKDVIYIDVEDDITAIIGKVKDSKEKIVALVPPKRIGILQSAVNLRLLQRAASQHDKHLVLISNNSALTALAAAAKVPVAKNLQSKPELAEISALSVDDDDDIIDGSQLPVGELARIADKSALGAAALSSPELEAIKENAAEERPRATPPLAGQALKKPKAKVPNFNKFRKRMIFAIGGGVLLIGFLVWAIFFAPSATVIITARTTDSSANAKVSLADAAATSMSAGTLKTTTQQIPKSSTVDVTPTGSKQVGTKATGSMTVTRTSISSTPISVPVGTTFTSNDNHVFASTQAATLGGTTIGPNGVVQDSATISVQASDVGEDYNLSARSYQSSVSGISAQGSDMAGGTSKTITVVTNDDVQKAVAQLAQQNTDDIKKQLAAKFNDTFIVLDQTFKTDTGKPQVTPGVDQEVPAGSKASLTTTVTYSLTAVAKADVSHYLDDYFSQQIQGLGDRRVYDNGASKVTFTNVAASTTGYTVNLVATAKIGPKIDDQNVKDSAKGKRFGDIQSSIESIQGVDNVDVKFWPFWVSTAPNDTKKINVQFNLNES
ncbi:MAG TPA: hypothetical protein VLG36_05810 [Candidatus Chromulinivoraceae bacterium]|nr:hypothetical protein [Candidatus Chromulinivoraceae bacterium]